MTVIQNLRIITDLKKKKNYLPVISKCLKEVGLDDTYLIKKIYELSGGEQQRISICKMILKESEILLLDEPTSNLDLKTSLNIMHIFKQLNTKGTTIVMVTHDESILKFATKIICVENKDLVIKKIT